MYSRFVRVAWILFTLVWHSCLAKAQAISGNASEDILKSQAFWIDRYSIAVPTVDVLANGSYKLFSDPDAHLAISRKGLAGRFSVVLTYGGALTEAQAKCFPQLVGGYTVLKLPVGITPAIEHALLKGQLAVSVQRSDGALSSATGLQIADVLDDLFAYSGSLGVQIHHPGAQAENAWHDFDDDEQGSVKIKVWAPTAQSMRLQLFLDPLPQSPTETVQMHEHDGVWVAMIDARWIGHYYLFDERVYAPSRYEVVEHAVTDPYSFDLALNGAKSRIIDIDDPANAPQGWDADRSPELTRINDLSIYELHVRDFSVADTTVPAEHRGTYLAFTDSGSDGMKHLKDLATAGLKAAHLLPTFHFSGVDEDRATWQSPGDLSRYPPDGKQQQAAVSAVKAKDAYNWGYSPLHFFAPEGAYATYPGARVREYRSMVMALHRTGLRVIQDVVFNHTSGVGEESDSILDKIVPGYYNRLNSHGQLQTATCCADTASEHAMMAKLQQDAIVWNAKHYKIDGFRFDLMGFTFLTNLKGIKTALQQLTLQKDGIDGSKIYLYGEGWDFGETAHNALGTNASQLNLYGSGVGSYNDRLRDGIRGGTVTGDASPQGFASGLLTDPSKYTNARLSQSEQRRILFSQEQWICLGLTGNLRDYRFTDANGTLLTGAQVVYNGHPAGYAAAPAETVNYVSAHDNQDIFDAIQLKVATREEATARARRLVLSMSIVALGQGIPFFMGGDDLMRSKDMDGNSYDSGDWFNKIDWSGHSNNWGIGLPFSEHDGAEWPAERPLLAKDALKPTAEQIHWTGSVFKEFLQVRYSSGLFRLATLSEIQQYIRFLVPPEAGVIAMELDAEDRWYGPYRHILVIINATMHKTTTTALAMKGMALHLHPVQAHSQDEVLRTSAFDESTGMATVPALTTAVFVTED